MASIKGVSGAESTTTPQQTKGVTKQEAEVKVFSNEKAGAQVGDVADFSGTEAIAPPALDDKKKEVKTLDEAAALVKEEIADKISDEKTKEEVNKAIDIQVLKFKIALVEYKGFEIDKRRIPMDIATEKMSMEEADAKWDEYDAKQQAAYSKMLKAEKEINKVIKEYGTSVELITPDIEKMEYDNEGARLKRDMSKALRKTME